MSAVEPEGSHLREPSGRASVRLIHTSTVCRDIDQAAKYIGAGAATVGVAGSGIVSVDENEDTHLSRCTHILIRNLIESTKFVGGLFLPRSIFQLAC